MNIKEFEKEVSLANEKDILVTVLICVQELLKREIAKKKGGQDDGNTKR